MGTMTLKGTTFSTVLDGGNPTATRTVKFPDKDFVVAPTDSPVFTGVVTSTGQIILPYTNAGIESGSTTTANTPFVDFHSSGNSIDYDSRIMASGGSTTVGSGTLSFYATGGSNFTGPVGVPNATATNQAVNLGQFPASKAGNGYQKLPNGLIMQWGLQGVGAIGGATITSITVTFPIAFPSACLSIVSTMANQDGGNVNTILYNSGISASSAAVLVITTAALNSCSFFWTAIGY